MLGKIANKVENVVFEKHYQFQSVRCGKAGIQLSAGRERKGQTESNHNVKINQKRETRENLDKQPKQPRKCKV